MTLESMQEYFTSYKPWVSLIIVILSMVLYGRLHRLAMSRVRKSISTPAHIGNIDLIFNLVKYILVFVLFIVVLNINGVNVSTLAAGVGVSGIVIGFALQDILKDWIMGISIVWDGYYAVGDVIQYGDYIGKVTDFNLKTTKIRDIVNGNLVSISNRNISEVQILSDWIDIDVPCSYDMSVTEMTILIDDLRERIENLPSVTSADYLKVSELASSRIMHRVRIHCDPVVRFQVRRDAQAVVVKTFEDHNIAIPYEHLDVQLR